MAFREFMTQPTQPIHTVGPAWPIYRGNGDWWFDQGNEETYDSCGPFETVEEAMQALANWVKAH